MQINSKLAIQSVSSGVSVFAFVPCIWTNWCRSSHQIQKPLQLALCRCRRLLNPPEINTFCLLVKVCRVKRGATDSSASIRSFKRYKYKLKLGPGDVVTAFTKMLMTIRSFIKCILNEAMQIMVICCMISSVECVLQKPKL